ncbi:unnamed protein product [marine sediment metagenome]|uniref:Uncharacterized protein n=1 Tax=marine sediment metagenome TaxID=412755 RepID=X0VMT8_9ZZZZ
MVNKKSKDYRQGLIDGYHKAMKDYDKNKKKVDKYFKPLKKAIEKLRSFK